MALKTGMLVGVIGTNEIGVLIQIREASKTCVIKLNNGTLKKNVPLDDVEEARDMADTKENKSPIKLAASTSPIKLAAAGPPSSPPRGGSSPKAISMKPSSPTALAPLAVSDKTSPSKSKKAAAIEVGDKVNARHRKTGGKWTPGKVTRVRADGTMDVEFDDGQVAIRLETDDVQERDGHASAKSAATTSLSPKKTATSKTRAAFSVGDAILAQYKGGKRSFPGKISAVHADNTYDITYDDGDVEKRVAEAMIEAVQSKGSESKATADSPKKASDRFAVNQAIRARYKKGTRWFPGKIKRANADGTFDILYEDGDVETRVDREYIEGVEQADNPPRKSDSPTKARTESKPSTSEAASTSLKVGDAVKARYKRGAKYFPGKVIKVRMNGTYDIRYEDGDEETGVEIEMIERVGDGGSPTRPKSPAKTTDDMAVEVGDRVKANYKKGKALYPGKIMKVHSNGTYDIKYDDGDSEQRVARDLIQLVVGSTRDDKTESSGRSQKQIEKGDKVRARYKGGAKFFSGTITRRRDDGTFDIEYEDGDTELRVKADHIELVSSGVADKTSESPKKKVANSFEVGDAVRARYKKGTKLYPAKITKAHRDGTYDVRYDDGDTESRVGADMIETNSEVNAETSSFKVGERVQAKPRGQTKRVSATIQRVRSDGTYDVKFTDGDTETRVGSDRLERAQLSVNTTKGKQLQVGDKVRARYKGGSKYFNGEIVLARTDGTFDIKYEDGDSEKHVESEHIELVEQSHKTSSPETDKFDVDQKVQAYYKGGKKLFGGKVTRARSDGTYDIEYDDGDSETRVKSSLIKPLAAKLPTDDKNTDKKSTFDVGDKVKARYQKGSRWFSGKIIKVRPDETYDIRYEDGDEEQRVKSEYIELAERVSSTKTTTKPEKDDIFGDDSEDERAVATKKQSPGYKKGDTIEANFKEKGKFHRGVIAKVHSDGTCDIEYDASASEKRVAGKNIRKLSTERDVSSSDNENASSKRRNLGHSKESEHKEQEPGSKSGSEKRMRYGSPRDNPTSDSDSSSFLKIGMRVTYRKAPDKRSRRIGVVKRVRRDGSCDIQYKDGETSKRIESALLLVCSGSEGESSDDSRRKSKKPPPTSFRRHQRVVADWRRSSKFSTPRQTSVWRKATVLECNVDSTYTIRYEDGVVEEDAPACALKAKTEKHNRSLNSDSSGSDHSHRTRRHRKRQRAPSRVNSESLYLLQQLALSLIEEGAMKKRASSSSSTDNSDDSSSTSSSSSGSSAAERTSVNGLEKAARRLLDARILQEYYQEFKLNDSKGSGKISRSKVIGAVEKLCCARKPSTKAKTAQDDDAFRSETIKNCLTEWFETYEDLRTHRRFDFGTFVLALAYARHRLGKMQVEQAVATVLDGRFASQHEYKRQLQLWQQKLGFRVFETLQRLFHEHALPNMIPSRVRVSSLQSIFDSAVRTAVPSKPLEVYLQQLKLFPHQTLLFPEFLCCYYQLYGSASEVTGASVFDQKHLELRPIAYVASCMFSNGDSACHRHGDLVRRLCVGRTPAQQELILRFREAFESLLNVSGDHDELLPTAQLAAFVGKVTVDPTLLTPAVTVLTKRSASVSLVEVFASCGFIIDELTTAPTIGNAIEKMRARLEVAEVRRIIGLVRNMCLKVLRFPNNSDYWRIRTDNDSFHRKLGRFDGATSLLEAAGFVEYKATHFELRGAREADGKRASALARTTLDRLREICVQLDAELSLLDGVESVTSILERISEESGRQGRYFSLEECQGVLQHLLAYIENILKNPKDSRCWRIREGNATFQRQVGHLPFAADLMAAVGYELLPSTQGNIFVLRGTAPLNPSNQPGTESGRQLVTASLSNFAFSTVSGQMEWFLWRRKQEIDSLLQGELQHYIGHGSTALNAASTGLRPMQIDGSSQQRTAVELVKMYPYGTNTIDIFNKTQVQQQQIEMLRACFLELDRNESGFLSEIEFAESCPPCSNGQSWVNFDAFDIGRDGSVDFADFVAAFGPLLDHSFDIDHGLASSQEKTNPLTLCESISAAIGQLRLSTSLTEASKVIEHVLAQLQRILQEPLNKQHWRIDARSFLGDFVNRSAPARELLRLAGFHQLPGDATCGDVGNGSVFELTPQRVRFATSAPKAMISPPRLDEKIIATLQTTAAVSAGHYRALRFPSVSDVGAVSRALGALPRYSEGWTRLVELTHRCIANVVAHPDDERYRQLRMNTHTFSTVVNGVQGGINLLLSVGFRETNAGTLVLGLDTQLAVLQARELEFRVGTALLRARKRDAGLHVSAENVAESDEDASVDVGQHHRRDVAGGVRGEAGAQRGGKHAPNHRSCNSPTVPDSRNAQSRLLKTAPTAKPTLRAGGATARTQKSHTISTQRARERQEPSHKGSRTRSPRLSSAPRS